MRACERAGFQPLCGRFLQGIPTIVTQCYLVMISVIMAWQLSRFEEVRDSTSLSLTLDWEGG